MGPRASHHSGTTRFGVYGFTKEVLGGTPWDSPEAMQRNNPVAYAANFSTPMLITHGEKDYRVPLNNALEFWTVLQRQDVPSRLVVFPELALTTFFPRWYFENQAEVDAFFERAMPGPETQPLFDAAPGPRDADAVAVHLLLHRLPEGLAADDQAGLPMNLLARHGLTAAQVAAGQGEPLLRDWAGELLAALPPPSAHPGLFRRLRAGFDRARLARLAAGRGFDPPGPFATLLRAWRLARRS